VAVGKWPPVIPSAQWDFAQELLAFRSTAARSEQAGHRTPRLYLLRCLAVCGNCGTAIAGAGRTMYRCTRSQRQDGQRCARTAARLLAYWCMMPVTARQRLGSRPRQPNSTVTAAGKAAHSTVDLHIDRNGLLGHRLYDVTEWRSAVIASSASVTTASSALAVFLARGTTAWEHALFIFLVVIAAIAFVVLLGAVLGTLFRGLASWWPSISYQVRIKPSQLGMRLRPWAARSALAGITGCAIVAVGFLLLEVHPGAQSPPPRPEATFHDPDSFYDSAVAFSPDGRTLVTGYCTGPCNSAGGTARTDLWNVNDGKIIATFTEPGTSSGVNAVAVSPDGRTIAAGYCTGRCNSTGGVGRTSLWNVASRKMSASLTDPGPGFFSGVVGVTFSQDGSIVATADGNGSTFLWNTTTKKIIATLTDPNSSQQVQAAAFSPNGGILAAGDGNGSIYLWNTSTAKVITTLDRPPSVNALNIQLALAFSPDGQVIAASYGGAKTYLWSIMTGKVITILTDPGRYPSVDAIAFSPDGKTLATGDYDTNSTCLWNAEKYSIIATLHDPDNNDAVGVEAIAFSPDGKSLATSDADNTYLWNLGWLAS
jgi:WD40 repeat protein